MSAEGTEGAEERSPRRHGGTEARSTGGNDISALGESANPSSLARGRGRGRPRHPAGAATRTVPTHPGAHAAAFPVPPCVLSSVPSVPSVRPGRAVAGLWSQADSTSYFKDFVIIPKITGCSNEPQRTKPSSNTTSLSTSATAA